MKIKNIKLKKLTFSNQNWNKKNKNPEKSGKIRKNAEKSRKIRKSKK